MQGWIKLHNKFLNWEWYDDNNVKVLFLHCILKANWQQKQWRGNTIERGQFITSLSNLSAETNLTLKQTRLALDKLKKTNEITTKGANQFTTITVCKYDVYQEAPTGEGQAKGTPEGKQKTNGGQTEGKQRATTKEDKKIRSKEDKTLLKSDKPDLSTKKRFVFKNELLKSGADEKLVDEWLKIRKSKKGVNSEKALADFYAEVKKSKITINQALTFITDGSRQWRGFKAIWYENELQKGTTKTDQPRDYAATTAMSNPNRK